MSMFPADNIDVNNLLNDLESVGFIQRYEVDNVKYIQIVNFEKHQSPHSKEAESTIQAPDKHGTSTGCEVIGNKLKESVKSKKARTVPTELPDFINKDVWSDYVQHRKEKRQTLKPTTTKRILKDLTTWHSEGVDVNDVLLTSIRNGWTGVFKPKGEKKKVPMDDAGMLALVREHNIKLPDNCNAFEARKAISNATGMAL
jgi:hypothetical protein